LSLDHRYLSRFPCSLHLAGKSQLGGRYNFATNFAFAAGSRARAIHTGSFVWADSTDEDFATTGTNQFLIRATGGVGIGEKLPDGSEILQVDTHPLTVYTAAAVQELHRELEAENRALRERLARLEELVQQLQKAIGGQP